MRTDGRSSPRPCYPHTLSYCYPILSQPLSSYGPGFQFFFSIFVLCPVTSRTLDPSSPCYICPSVSWLSNSPLSDFYLLIPISLITPSSAGAFPACDT
jgi:hypothetical protein